MAIIKDPKDPQGLMRALGPGALGMSSSEENLIGDEPTSDGFEDDDNTTASKSNTTNVNRRLDDVIKLVQEISKKSGLQKDEVYKVLSQISASLQNNVQKTLTSAMDVINPKIKRDLIEITQLLDTGDQSDQKLALKKLEDLQKKFNIDLKQYNKELGKNLDKLNEAVEKMATEKEEKIEKAKQIQASELSQGRSARVDEKSGNLRYLSRDEIKAEEIKARNIEKEIVVQKKEFEKLLKQEGTFKDGKFDNVQQGKLNDQREKILKLEEKSTKIRSVIGERQPTFLQKTGEVLRGERGPEIVKQLMAPFYETFAASAKLLDDLSFGMFGKIGKKIFNVGSALFTKSFSSLITDFSKGFTKFKENTLNKLKEVFGPLLDSMMKGLKKFGGAVMDFLGLGGDKAKGGAGGGGLSNLLGMGKGTTGGGAARAIGMGSRALPLAGLLTGGGGAAAAGAGATAAGGGLMAGLGGLATAAAPFLLPALGIAAAVGGIGYLGKKAYDKYQDNKTKTPEELQAMTDEFSASEMPSQEIYEDVSKDTKKILGKSDTALKRIDTSIIEPAELKAESEEFMRDGEMSDKGVNLFNQNAPTINNAGDSKTVVPTSYNNPNPTFNIINVTRVS
jgi:hypothetical protein